MTLTQAFIDGWNEGVRPFRAALRPMLTGGGIISASCLVGVLLDLAEWPTIAATVITTGCLTGSFFLIYAWIAVFRATGLFTQKP